MTTPRRVPSVLEYGDRALLVELGDTGRVLAWTAGLSRAGLEGLGDVVPAAETLLVVAAEGASVDALRRAVAAFPEPPPLPRRRPTSSRSRCGTTDPTCPTSPGTPA